jgi:hypothetical protein
MAFQRLWALIMSPMKSTNCLYPTAQFGLGDCAISFVHISLQAECEELHDEGVQVKRSRASWLIYEGCCVYSQPKSP